MQDLARHGIEEGLRAFRLPVVDQQPDVVELDPLPQGVGAAVVEAGRPELALDALDRFQHPAVVVVDAVLGDVTDRAPVAGLEMAFGGPGAFAEERVVAVEPFPQRKGDRSGRIIGGRGKPGRNDG